MKKLITAALALLLLLVGCSTNQTESNVTTTSGDYSIKTIEEIPLHTEWSDDATFVTLDNDVITIDGNNAVSQQAGDVYIRTSGTYVFSGQYTAGSIIVDQEDEGIVNLILNEATIETSQSSAIQVEQADETIISVVPDTANQLISTTTTTNDDLTAVLYSSDNLVINGSGTLTVTSSSNDAITGRDDLFITEVDLYVNAIDDGIVGRDLAYISDSTITATVGGDGIKTTNDEEDQGNLVILSSDVTINSDADGIQSIASLYIEEGNYDLTTGEGHPDTIDVPVEQGHQQPQMPIEADINVIKDELVNNNTFSADVEDELKTAESLEEIRLILEEAGELEALTPPGAINEGPEQGATPPGRREIAGGTNDRMPPRDNDQNGIAPDLDDERADETSEDTSSTKGLKAGSDLVIVNGTFSIDSLDDSIHSDETLTIEDGEFTLLTGDDAIHADRSLIVNGGSIDIDMSYEGMEANQVTINDGVLHITAMDDGINTGMGWSDNTTDEVGYLHFNGGQTIIDATGDGIDSNATIELNDGLLLINGPTTMREGAIDYDDTFEINGGTLIAAGNSNMAQVASDTSNQNAILYKLNDLVANETIAITDSDGNIITAFTPSKSYDSIVISTPELPVGDTYTLFTGATVEGESEDGLYTEGNIIDYDTSVTFELNDTITHITSDGISETSLTVIGDGVGPNG